MNPADEVLGSPEPWPAPAKLNLCLHIVGRRADGYHLLQSAMQHITLSDELRFYRRPHGCIERIAGPNDIPPDSDLTVRAANLLAQSSDRAQGVGIVLDKRIPMQAGLGGGSSDAATVLLALNQLWGLQLPQVKLAELGLKLGADVPFFVHGRSAWIEGIGEQLTFCDLPAACYLVIKPQSAVSTSEIFQAPELTRNSPVTTIRAFLGGGGRNDCTPSVRRRYPEVAESLDWLSQFADARLTGTGSCIFAAMADEAAASAILARLPSQWRGFVVRGLDRSPLLARVERERQISAT
jgi:4-diphosphocytidyl-2-C-methyl-D-erythritol kinase